MTLKTTLLAATVALATIMAMPAPTVRADAATKTMYIVMMCLPDKGNLPNLACSQFGGDNFSNIYTCKAKALWWQQEYAQKVLRGELNDPLGYWKQVKIVCMEKTAPVWSPAR